MKPLDDEVKSALRRVEPPAGFAERVLAQARRQPDSNPGFVGWLRVKFPPRAVRWAVAFGAACVLILAGARYRQYRQEKIQGMRAAAQARQALAIASGKLNAAFQEAARPSRRNLEN
jgi:hypothetical protein